MTGPAFRLNRLPGQNKSEAEEVEEIQDNKYRILQFLLIMKRQKHFCV
jgi:hypothetical protein